MLSGVDPDALPTRRVALRLVAGAAAAGLPAATLPTPAADGASDPHPAWLREWRALLDRMNVPGFRPGADLPETAEWRRMEALEGLIGATAAATVAGVAAQLALAAHYADRSAFTVGADGAFQGAIATLERLAEQAVG